MSRQYFWLYGSSQLYNNNVDVQVYISRIINIDQLFYGIFSQCYCGYDNKDSESSFIGFVLVYQTLQLIN